MINIFTFLLHLLFGSLFDRFWSRRIGLLPGTCLHDRYVISQIHEQGRDNTVYRAHDKSREIDVAIKENCHRDRAAHKQFEVEATILAHVSHPNIPKACDYFMEAGRQFLVMDWIEGLNLQQLMQRRTLSTEEVLGWAVQLCDILHHLHSLRPSIIHRDVEPSNIILTSDGRLFLVDFGFAKIYVPERDGAKTLPRPVGVESIEIPDPEIAVLSIPAVTDARSDQYSLAATLYALLTGAPPPDSRERLARNPELAPIRPKRPELSPFAEAAIFQALSLHPNGRFRDIQDFKVALGR